MFSLYVHLPFCRKKCFYCSYVVNVESKFIDQYLFGLKKELSSWPVQKIDTLYWGGGTPSVLSQRQLSDLRSMLLNYFDCSSIQEFTIECNPEDVDPVFAKFLYELGVNRISLGVQSFADKYLKVLGRAHNSYQTRKAYDCLRGVGFKNINIDLMFSLPGQTLKDIQEDLNALSSLNADHVSAYSLSVEPKSRFFVEGVSETERFQSQHYQLICEKLESLGYHQYEISNFSKEKRESLHNTNYWLCGDYIGLGVAAHSHLGQIRAWNVDNIFIYIEKASKGLSFCAGNEILSPQKQLSEAVVFGLRMNRGIKISELENKFGVSLSLDQQNRIRNFVLQGLLCGDTGFLKPTNKGRLVLDAIAAYLV